LIWAKVVHLKVYGTDFHSVPKIDKISRPLTTAACNQDFGNRDLEKFQKDMDILLRYLKEQSELSGTVGIRVEFELEMGDHVENELVFWCAFSSKFRYLNLFEYP
jgi:hypothetical protein